AASDVYKRQVFMSLRAGAVNERLLFSLLGIDDWEWQQALEHGTLFASLPFFAMYLGRRFSSYFPPLLHWLTASICGVLLALIFITPPSVYSHTVPIFQATALTYAFLWMGAVMEHVIKKERAALYLLFGGMLFIVAGVNDILYASNSIDSTNLIQLGALGFILMSFFYKGDLVKHDALVEEIPVVMVTKVAHGLEIAYDEYQLKPSEALFKYLAAESLCFALVTWENATNKNKIALAEMSGLWRVTNDGGTLKTRTFDKYLKVGTLPQNPRYKLIAKTLRYIANIDGVADEDVCWIMRVADVYDKPTAFD
ncbi:MAG: 7TM-DISM domain-containing protein, partial [Pseudomonadales bacterium]|nr:7TM-DISM domain-containing protein [Pseudomonadales bacterium]